MHELEEHEKEKTSVLKVVYTLHMRDHKLDGVCYGDEA
jgi:hypothetical protein